MTHRELFPNEFGHANKKRGIKVKEYIKTFSHPDEHKEYIERLKLGSEFDMRYRGLVEFYGADLIAYKRKYKSNKQVNEFLRVFSKYLTDHLEDHCPASWDECKPAFWEEFIYACYPKYMKISVKQEETKIFHYELKRFVHWLDKRTGLAWCPIVEKMINEAFPEVKTCEKLLNELFLYEYPRIHQPDWEPTEDMNRMNVKIQACHQTISSVFEVIDLKEDIITIRDIDTDQTYQLVDFPSNPPIGILLDGTIGIQKHHFHWNWYLTQGLYPNTAEKYIEFIG